MPIRESTHVIRAALTVWIAVPGVLALASEAGAQVATAKRENSVRRGPFAMPWEVTFGRIQTAMRTRDYEVEHVRRVRDPRTLVWSGLVERLVHRGGSASTERFALNLVGVEGRSISAAELAQRQHRFDRQAGTLHDYQSFRVTDSDLAAKNYSLVLIAIRQRLTRPVYQMVAYAPGGMRSTWLLELDMETGYPLYRGEYDIAGRLVAEVEVNKFKPESAPANTKWWKPRFAVTEHADAAESLVALKLPGTAVPAPATLPAGYRFEIARVVQDPIDASKRSVFVYTDGIDRMFVVQTKYASQSLLPRGEAIGILRDSGMTQCIFAHAGVAVSVVGRGDPEPLKLLAQAFYAQMIQTAK